MSKNICFFFEVHQPYRLNLPENPDNCPLSDFFHGPVGDNPNYLYGNRNLFEKVAKTSYLPATEMWLDLLQKFPNLRFSLALSGVFLEQCQEYGETGQKVIKNFQKLVQTGQVELLSETYYHSLASLFSVEEFARQITLHQDLLQKLFNYKPTSFRNTEMIYDDKIGTVINKLGFARMVIEDSGGTEEEDSPQRLRFHKNYDLTEEETASLSQFKDKFSHLKPTEKLELLVNNYALAREFFQLQGSSSELLLEKTLAKQDLVCLFFDFETFGEHNTFGESSDGLSEDVASKLATYFEKLTDLGATFSTVSGLEAKGEETLTEFAASEHISWANSWHSLVSWRGNAWQEEAFSALENLFEKLQPHINSSDPQIREFLHFARRLTTSDNFYYMAKLPGPDGIGHDYFNAYTSQEVAFETYMAVLKKMEERLEKLLK